MKNDEKNKTSEKMKQKETPEPKPTEQPMEPPTDTKPAATPEDQMQQRMEKRKAERAEQKKAELAKKEKSRARQKKAALAAKITLGVLIILSLLFLAAQSLGNVTFSRLFDGAAQAMTNLRPGPGYPLLLKKSAVLKTETFGDNLVVLQSDRLIMLNSTAKEILNHSHTYSSPRLSVSNSRLLLGDGKTGRYTVFNSGGVLYEGDLSTEIYCCSVGNSGDYAFSTKSEAGASLVSFYSVKDNRKLFDFKCADEYIIGISLSSNGKKAALIGVGTKDALDYSMLYIISLTEHELIKEFKYDGIRLHTVFYSDKDTVVTAYNNGYSMIKNDKDRQDHPLDEGSISSFAFDSSGSFALAVNGYSNDAGSSVCAFDSKGKKLYSANLKCKVEGFDFGDKHIAAAGSDGLIYMINADNAKKPAGLESTVKAESVAVIKKNVYALGNGTIAQIKT